MGRAHNKDQARPVKIGERAETSGPRETRKRSRPAKSTHSSKRLRLDASQHEEDESDMTDENDDLEERDANASSATRPSNHIRFGSEEPPAMATAPQQESPDSSDDNGLNGSDEEDEDEAPEDVTASAAEASSKAAAQKTLRLAEKQRANAKRSRHDREERLKDQAKSSVKRQKAVVVRDTSPDLLPEELLADLPEEREPTPDPVDMSAALEVPRRNRLIKFEERDPKPRKVGSVRINVLRKAQPNLAAKASKGSRSVKEAWLAGQRGNNAQTRKRTGGGFLRK